MASMTIRQNRAFSSAKGTIRATHPGAHEILDSIFDCVENFAIRTFVPVCRRLIVVQPLPAFGAAVMPRVIIPPVVAMTPQIRVAGRTPIGAPSLPNGRFGNQLFHLPDSDTKGLRDLLGGEAFTWDHLAPGQNLDNLLGGEIVLFHAVFLLLFIEKSQLSPRSGRE